MNVFTVEVMDEFETIIDQVVADARVKGAVITSGKDSFSGGADLTMLQAMLGLSQEEQAKDPEKATKLLFDGVGRMGWPVAQAGDVGQAVGSAINGTCMGGAFELSLACHGRVAADSDKVKMALPEVKVGLFPGAGGTQRVPRLTDQQQALQMLTSGQQLSPQKAKAMGLIHEIARAGEADRGRQGDDQERAEAGRALGREGLQAAGRADLFGGGRQSLAAGHRHPAPRDLRQLSGGLRDPEMRL